MDAPNKVWVSDVTYIWTIEGLPYLYISLELFFRMAVGWAMNSRITRERAIPALSMAVTHRRQEQDLVFHSDRSMQYQSKEFRKQIEDFEMIQSMSHIGNY